MKRTFSELAVVFFLCQFARVSPAADGETVGKKYAVLVGIKAYDHNNLSQLEFCENDVTMLAELLRPSGYEVVLLTDSAGKKDAALEPTLANINKQMLRVFDQCKRDDLVVVALAGHGLQFEKDPQAYFCPKDAKPLADRTETLLALDDLYKKLGDCGAGVKLLFVDACRNDPRGGRGRGVDGGQSKIPPKGVYALFSCSPGERAFEHRDLKHGIFFHHVLEGLKGAAKDSNEQISFDTLALYVRTKVPPLAKRLFDGAQQRPLMQIAEASGASPVLLSLSNTLLVRALEEYHEAIRLGTPANLFADKFAGQTSKWRDEAERGSLIAALLYGRSLLYGTGVTTDVEAGAKWVRKAADGGLVTAQTLMGFCCENGKGVAKDQEEAVRWYRQSAEQDYVGGQFNLARCYELGRGVERDEKLALSWYRRAAALKSAPARFALGLCYLNGRGVDRDADAALRYIRDAAEQGYPRAEVQLGRQYASGSGVEKNLHEAVKWYRRAADRNSSEAHYQLGLCYERGEGVDKDRQAAVACYRQSAGLDNGLGQTALAWCLLNGVGVDKDAVEAVRLYRLAAAKGLTRAQFYLGWCLRNGTGVDKDEKEAVSWFRKAAEQGDAYAATHLGFCYEGGHGVEKDRQEAVAWYRKAAEKGNAEAECCLGVCYLNGLGVEKDEKEAVRWLSRAVEKGHARAHHALGHCHEHGKGVEKNQAEAQRLYDKAAKQGFALAAKKPLARDADTGTATATESGGFLGR